MKDYTAELEQEYLSTQELQLLDELKRGCEASYEEDN